MSSDPETLRHWRYFLILEDEFAHALRFVEPHASNNHVFSLEFVKQLIAICAQFETVARLYSVFKLPLQPPPAGDGIQNLRQCLLQVHADLREAKAVFRLRNEDLHPFHSWDAQSPPPWWTAYNRVKHDPSAHASAATLANVRDVIAGLGLLTLLFVGSRDAAPHQTLFDFTWARVRC